MKKASLLFVLLFTAFALMAAPLLSEKNVKVSNYKLSWDVASTANTAIYRAEHYGVFISTTNVQPASFSMLFEETLLTTVPNWENQPRELDISTYAGQNIYVAFRHFNSTDKDRIVIDNVKIRIVETGVADVMLLNEDFQGGIDNPAGEEWMPAGWTKLDADGDTKNWFFGVRQSNGAMRSESWANNAALTPNNWLITPSLYLGYVGIAEQQIQLSIYPNPVTDAIQVNTSGVINKLTITDLRGRVVYQSDALTSKLRIPVDQLVNGMYILRVFTDQGTAEKKIQVQK